MRDDGGYNAMVLLFQNLGETWKEVGIRACRCGCLNGGKHGRKWESERVDVGVSEIRELRWCRKRIALQRGLRKTGET